MNYNLLKVWFVKHNDRNVTEVNRSAIERSERNVQLVQIAV